MPHLHFLSRHQFLPKKMEVWSCTFPEHVQRRSRTNMEGTMMLLPVSSSLAYIALSIHMPSYFTRHRCQSDTLSDTLSQSYVLELTVDFHKRSSHLPLDTRTVYFEIFSAR